MSHIPFRFRQRVIHAAETALAHNQSVCLSDVFVYLDFLAASVVERWTRGIEPYLTPHVQAGPEKVARTKAIFAEWTKSRGLVAREVRPLARTVGPERELRFTAAGDTEEETLYRTHYFSPQVSESKQRKAVEKLAAPPEIVVFWILKGAKCSHCQEELFKGRFLVMEAGQPLCLKCAGMSDLEFLSAGDAALTRRARKYSARSAVVVKFSRARKRYERQGILVEKEAIDRAERELGIDA